MDRNPSKQSRYSTRTKTGSERIYDEHAICERCNQVQDWKSYIYDYTFQDGSKKRLHSRCLEALDPSPSGYHQLNSQGTACATDCPVCHWVSRRTMD